jgi:hypothetical protein
LVFKISEDGSNLTLEDSYGVDCSITTNIEKDNIRFGKIYAVEFSNSDISGFIFHENGSLEVVWRDGRDNEIFPDACKYYDNIIIVRLGEYIIFNISLDGKQITII